MIQVSSYLTAWLARSLFSEVALASFVRSSRHVQPHFFHYPSSRVALFLFRLLIMLLFWPTVKRKVVISLHAIRGNASCTAIPQPGLGQWNNLAFAEMVLLRFGCLFVCLSICKHVSLTTHWRIAERFGILFHYTMSSSRKIHWYRMNTLEDLHKFIRMNKTDNIVQNVILQRARVTIVAVGDYIFWVCL